jgi:hypothetical protein
LKTTFFLYIHCNFHVDKRPFIDCFIDVCPDTPQKTCDGTAASQADSVCNKIMDPAFKACHGVSIVNKKERHTIIVKKRNYSFKERQK